QYTSAAGGATLIAWVRLPSVNTNAAATNTVIYMYYGNSSITSSLENVNGVWDANYLAAWHLKEDPGPGGADDMADSTSNANHATAAASMVAADSVAAKIGQGIDFDGLGDVIEDADGENYINGLTAFTLSAWIQSDVIATEAGFVTGAPFTELDDAFSIRYAAAGVEGGGENVVAAGVTVGAAKVIESSTFVQTLNWQHVSLTWASGGQLTLYIDGDANTPTFNDSAFSGSVSGTSTFLIGVGPFDEIGVAGWDGIVDEVRISNSARDCNWIKTEFNNQDDPGDIGVPGFYTVGGEESDPPLAVRLTRTKATLYAGEFSQVVQVEWRTSQELDHLGFHVHREQNGQLLRVTPSLVAGSALKTGPQTVLSAGQGYSWWDVLPADSGTLQYWLEEIDLKGQSTWHGPVTVKAAKGLHHVAAPERVRSVLLSRLGRGNGKAKGQTRWTSTGVPWQGTRQATVLAPTPEQLAVQWRLAGQRALKLEVPAEGWYRVDQPALVAAGLDPAVDPRLLQLYVDGREVPLVVTGEQDHRFDPWDTIEFYGLGMDTPWTGARTYWLIEGSHSGLRMGQVPGVGLGQGNAAEKAAPASFPFTVEWAPRFLYFAALKNGDSSNFFGPVVMAWPVEQNFTLTHLDPAPPGQAGLEVTLQGVTLVPHQVEIQLNGVAVGTVAFGGQGQGSTHLSFPQAQLQDGANRVTLVARGGWWDISVLGSVRLTYWHTYDADGDVLRSTVPAGQPVTIGGFSSRHIRVLDITQPDAVQAVQGQVKKQGAGYAVTLVAPGSGTRTLLTFTDGIAATPAAIRLNEPSQWHAAGHGADLVILTPRAFLPSLTTLKAWRESQGWTVALIDVEDLYDEFTFGAKSPWALRAFVQHARQQWAPAPRFLLLAGDASVDPRNFMGLGDRDFVPTKLIDTDFMETASDDWFGDLDLNGVPELAVGRLAVRTAEEAASVVQKLISYDQARVGAKTAVLVADRFDRFDSEAASDQVKAVLLRDKVTVQEIYRSRTADRAARNALLAAFSEEPWLVNFVGHGSVEVWQGSLLTAEDARALTSGPALPFVAAMTCLNGFFHDVYTEQSLAEALQTADAGGAIAIWASSAVTRPDTHVIMNRRLVQGLLQGLTVGEAAAQAKAAVSDQDVRRSWILFGDPTTRLK
ncbi:C25 family cysteine peptidase, partial [Nitrospiraceae bacterium AH_259_D15_M11_P09]|nr:C25 family cysteine peptidase [Nitrospiraceae bacterium AH_259_D15_M11_P09]